MGRGRGVVEGTDKKKKQGDKKRHQRTGKISQPQPYCYTTTTTPTHPSIPIIILTTFKYISKLIPSHPISTVEIQLSPSPISPLYPLSLSIYPSLTPVYIFFFRL